MPKGPTPRQVARTENIARIKELALTQLAESGASTLSLRAIARELNLVSSAIYRYYASRDDLITALIVDAYEDLGSRLEEAATSARAPWRRWVETCRVLRAWAAAEPHRWALIYGSAIPGYAAPADTIAPAGRVVQAFCTAATGAGPAVVRPIGRSLATQLDTTASALELDVDRPTMLALVGAFSRVVGLVTLELNGQFVGGFDPADALFDALVEREADLLGLPTAR
ncbi:TetR/AcrR family transcriptional regulator [Nocardioides sp. MAHUQ-72]|uniref:TetR/AcrR family transcriptional regulator n=1 Tax=unclassified Nocardioides TaxID=2615069 RepID=UPI003615B801